MARVHARSRPFFRRSEARTRAGRFLHGLLAPMERTNGWHLGERGPRGVQRLTGAGRADRDEDLLCDEWRTSVLTAQYRLARGQHNGSTRVYAAVEKML